VSRTDVRVTYRILHLSDLHLERAFAGLGCYGDVARRRREGLRTALRLAGDTARDRGCDLITLGGDIYEHESAGHQTGRFLATLFAGWAPMRVAIAPGNHDPLLPGSLWERTEWPENVHLFSEPVLTPLSLAGGLTLWGLAHRDPAWLGDPLACDPVGAEGGTHIALFHGAEMGSRPDGKSVHGPFRAEHIKARGFSLALCGHYHRRRLDGDARLLYPGSPEPLTFDEEGGRGPVLVEIGDNDRIRMEPLSLNSWHAVRADCDIDGAQTSADVHEQVRRTAGTALAGLPADRSMLRLSLRGEIAPEVAVDSAMVEAVAVDATGAAVVRVRDLSTAAIDAGAASLDRTARGAFTREVLGALERCDDEGERAVLDDALRYGLQALEGVEVGLR